MGTQRACSAGVLTPPPIIFPFGHQLAAQPWSQSHNKPPLPQQTHTGHLYAHTGEMTCLFIQTVSPVIVRQN